MSTSEKIAVGLVQIGENFNGQYYLPYSIGLLQAYARKKLANYDDYHFLLPLYKRHPLREAVALLKGADIVFFSAYMWNFNFSLALAQSLKADNPGCLIVFGGPQIPEDPERMEALLRAHHFVDCFCYGEGEIPFVKLLENFARKDWSKVPSLGYLNADRTFVRNESGGRISDLNDIPSPYLEGIFQPLIDANPGESWSAMWESNRGCPFSCTYCAWGKDSARSVYKYDLPRLFQEIDWFSEHKIEFIFCCDANFGMFKERDMQIVGKVAENKMRTGYPRAFSVQSTKNATQTIFELQRSLNSSGLQKGVNLALQSVNQETLKSVKRSNISSENFRKLQRMFTDSGIATFSDMILGLPDESYDTFADGVSSVIESGQHNRIQFINLAILENAEMASGRYIDKFGLIRQRCRMASHHTSVATEDLIPETQDLVVGTKTMPKQDWVRTRVFCWMTSLLHFDKLLQIPFVVLNKTCGAGYRRLIESFLTGDKRFPITAGICSFFNEKALAIQSGDTEFVASREWLGIYWPADEFIFIKLCIDNSLPAFYGEAKRIMLENATRTGADVSESLLFDACALNFELLKKPAKTEDIEIELRYNIPEFYQSALSAAPGPALEEGTFRYEIIRGQKIWNSWADWCREVVWFGSKRGDYLYPLAKIKLADSQKGQI